MPSNTKFSVKNIVLVSPSDLLKEREMCKKSIDYVNLILATIGKNYRVQLKGWEDVPPGVGRANEYIGKYLDMNHCDILIGMFWYKFGSPPGANRQDGGAPYKSGTEEELDNAFRFRESSGKPEIMIYWKRDELPKFNFDEDYVQYGRLIEFMQDCHPAGRHPAYFVEFFSNEFEQRLSQDLLKVLNTSS